jgi:hypothetical protein
MNKVIPAVLSVLTIIPHIVSAHGGEHMVAQVPLWASLSWPQTIALAVIAGGLITGLLLFLKKSKGIGISSGAAVAILVLSLMTNAQSSYNSQTAAVAVEDLPMHVELKGMTATVYRSPGCECCKGYIAALEKQGVKVEMIEVTGPELVALKAQKGVPSEMESCHTTIFEGYVVEGHVPFEALVKLHTEKPGIAGIGLGGMPIGTPGMPGVKTGPFVIQTFEGAEFLTL